jgi:hypothetical protein
MFMAIVLGVILAAAISLLLVLIPAIALQMLLRLVGPPPARPLPSMRAGETRPPVQEAPSRPLQLFRVAR